eukprot:TRINITY_DN14137_c0_g1_i2.p1 TRINITY_DN14137_c0_g1~~TRINITY_DN14137_c0_g1_i2.p1  ORF type:complete len:141 (+),score=13.76 TRINITY_DN14137_c0_g1_i2:108-530(+)
MVSDFGLARVVQDDTASYYTMTDDSCAMPLRWMAPESIFSRKFSRQSDIWMFGVSLWEILACGQLPYPDHFNIFQLVDGIQRGTIQLQLPPTVPEPWRMLVASCLQVDPSLRPSIHSIVETIRSWLDSDICDHPFSLFEF